MTFKSRACFLLLVATLLAAFTVPAFAAGQKFAVDPNHTQVYFTWNHAGFSNPGAVVNVGEGTLVWNAESPDQSSVNATIPVASIDTQVPALNKHLQSEFFEVKKFPTVTFKSTHVQRIGLSNHYEVTGDLTLHGVTAPVTLNATLNRIGQLPRLKAPAIGFDATTTIKRSDFGMGQYVPLVSDQVKIRITLQADAPKALEKETKEIQAESKP